MSRCRMYSRSDSLAMWWGGWLLEVVPEERQSRHDPVICRRVQRQTLKEFKMIPGCYEVDPDYFLVR